MDALKPGVGWPSLVPGTGCPEVADQLPAAVSAEHAVRFAYEGAAEHEHATLHGLATAYEGYFLLTARHTLLL